jgi:putative ABC transport system permease protein
MATYLSNILKEMWSRKIYMIINLISLTIGIAFCIFAWHYVSFEKSYDLFYKNEKNLYRLELAFYKNDRLVDHMAESLAGIGPSMKKDFHEVMEFGRIFPYLKGIATYNNTSALIEGAFLADNSFLTMLPLALVRGNPATALSEPSGVVISESMARKIFGNQDPMGKIIRWDRVNREEFTVTGVFKDLPPNTHLPLDMLFPIQKILSYFGTGWTGDGLNFYTYVLLAPGVNPKDLEAKFPAFLEKYIGPECKKNNRQYVYSLRPIRDIYHYSSAFGWGVRHGNIIVVYLLLGVGIFTLLMTWGNHVHLLTAGIACASPRVTSLKPLIIESLFLHIGGALAAILAVNFFILPVRKVLGMPGAISPFSQPLFWPILAAALFLSAILSGAYTLFIGPKSRKLTMQIFVVLQVTAFIGSLTGTIILAKQIESMETKDLKIATNQMMLIESPPIVNGLEGGFDKVRTFIKEMQDYSGIVSMSLGNVPGWKYQSSTEVGREGTPSFFFRRSWADQGTFEVFQYKLLAGRGLIKTKESDHTGAALINETALKLLGFDNPEKAVGQSIIDYNDGQKEDRMEIIGVIKNYYHCTSRYDIEPIIYRYYDHYGPSHFAFRLSAGKEKQTLEFIKNKWEKYLPGNPFKYYSLKEFILRQYESDHRVKNVFLGLTLLAVSILLLGLSGLLEYHFHGKQSK